MDYAGWRDDAFFLCQPTSTPLLSPCLSTTESIAFYHEASLLNFHPIPSTQASSFDLLVSKSTIGPLSQPTLACL